MVTLRLDIKQEVDAAQHPGQFHVAPERIPEFEGRYEALAAQGLKVNPPPVAVTPQLSRQGRVKQTPPKNWLDRLKADQREVLAFMYDFKVPFSNN
jgi:transposase